MIVASPLKCLDYFISGALGVGWKTGEEQGVCAMPGRTALYRWRHSDIWDKQRGL